MSIAIIVNIIVVSIVLFIFTALFLIINKIKNATFSLKEKVNYNICGVYLIISVFLIIRAIYKFTEDELQVLILGFLAYFSKGLLVTAYLFYIYVFKIAIEMKEHKVLCYFLYFG